MTQKKIEYTTDYSSDYRYGVLPTLLEFAKISFSSRPLKGPGFSISVRERAFSTAVCVLSAFQIESYLTKIASDRGRNYESRDNLLKNLSNPKFEQAIRELLVVRDSIAHSHLYKTTVYLNESELPKSSRNIKLNTAKLRAEYKMYVKGNKTLTLKLNASPVKINFSDAALAASLVGKIIEYETGRSYVVHDIKPDHTYNSLTLQSFISQLLSSLDSNKIASIRRKMSIIDKI